MYLENMEEELNYVDDYSNFVTLTEEKSFGDKLADDLKAVSGSTEPKKLSKLAKGGIALIGVGIISYVAFKIIKKRKKG